jgi:stage V sporulation protein SpoVS
MESCFVLYLESENPPNGIVTCSVAGVLTDGQRMVLRAPTETTIGQIVKALYMTEGVDRKMIEAVNRLHGSYRLEVDISEGDATKFVAAFRKSWSKLPRYI